MVIENGDPNSQSQKQKKTTKLRDFKQKRE